jgi:hypothetical protein
MEFDRLIQRLLDCQIDFVLVGGFAAVLHGAGVVTQDVDVALDFSRENLFRLSVALSELHPVHRITPQKLPFHVDEGNWQSLKNLYLKTDWGILDCLGEIAGIGGYREVLANSTPIALPIGTCRILTIEALIRAKETLARPHDLGTASALKAILSKRNRA